jgi:hypothetical protein
MLRVHPGALLLAGALILTYAAETIAQSGPENVVMSFTNLTTLDEVTEGHYEGWAIVTGTPVSTGNLNVNSAEGKRGEP